MSRVTDAHLIAALTPMSSVDGELSKYPLALNAQHADGAMRELQSGYGLVVDVELRSLIDIADQLDDRDQTLVQHGFTTEEIVALLAHIKNRAIDRIVPMGRALDFHPVWDGTDMLGVLTRTVTMPRG